MVPAGTPTGRILGLTRDGVPVSTASRMVKGVEYLVFGAAAGDYVASYQPASSVSGSSAGGSTASSAGGSTASPGDRKAPHARVLTRRVRVFRRGTVALRVRCPSDEQGCRVRLRLRRHGKTLATKTISVAGGATGRAVLRLNRATRRLARHRSLTVVAEATARDTAGNRATTTTHLRLLVMRQPR
jgi:hypothetical protein